MPALNEVEDYGSHYLTTIWRECGEFPGLSEILNNFDLTAYSPEVSWEYFKIYVYSCDSIGEDAAKWKYVRQISEREPLKDIHPDYRLKYLKILGFALREWEMDFIKELVPSLERLLLRLCRPPFNTTTQSSEVILSLMELVGPELREVLLTAPDTSFLNMEKACRSKNDAYLIDLGIWSIFHGCDLYLKSTRFPLDCFVDYSKKLFRTARTFGALLDHKRYFILREFSRHPIMDGNLVDLPPSGVYDLIAPRLSGVTNPFPKKLQQYVCGQVELSPNRLERYTEKMRSNLTLTRLEILEQLADHALEEEYPVDSKSANWKHTMKILHRSNENRRPLRRYLKAWLQGDRDYVLRHHQTQVWLSKHNGLNLSPWLEGVEMARVLDGLGKVTLKVEQDLEEILKMGHYVGSCLSLGGGFEFSAAAAALDINKQVIYAHDETGQVIARQLAAISDKEQLVFFEVYPLNVDPRLLEVFRDYDREFSRNLGIEIYTPEPGDGDYEIENIISEDWWDDGAWDFGISR